ncbi:putative methyltransferase, partial [Globisporangium splendens]
MSALWKRPSVLLGGAAIYVGTTAVAYLTFYEPKQDASAPAVDDARRLQVFNANATQYDKDVNFDEALTGISLMRRFLLRSATGRCLEVAAGTGRNLAYYPRDVALTLTDFSDGMLKQVPEAAKTHLKSCELHVMSAGALQFESDAFDTVVDTFGLCSMDDPVAALKEMQRVCSGKILLLEHGRSHYAWLSGILDKFAALHAQRWGCHWNRDILALVEQAGLEIETVHRFHFGTTYYIIAKPRNAKNRAVEDNE